MFEKILLPISSEFYPRNAMRRGVFLAEKFGSSIKILYIIEEKTLEKADRISDIYRTQYEKEETESNMEQEYLSVADRIVFEDAKKFFDEKGIQFDGKVVKGEFSDVIKDEIERERYDLILMGFEKGCLLHYRILENSDIPIWIESAAEGREVILAVCSNLAPNQKVPEISVELSRTLGWELRMLYVVDTQDRVEVDKMGLRSGRKSEEELISAGKSFLEEMTRNGIKASMVKGVLEKETIKAAKKIGAGLVVVGREQKKTGIMGLSFKTVKKKLVEKCNYSILFVN